jgi:nucleotide-binding universal stress UspA family protein
MNDRRSRKTVLVALDGTPAGERALPLAATLAQHWKAPLRLTHIRNPVEDAHQMDLRFIDNSKSLSIQSRSGAYLNGLAESLRRSRGVAVNCDTTLGTSIAGTLRSISESDVRMLVMARTGRSVLSRLWSGSVTDSLIGRLAVPLLLVPDGEIPAQGVPGAIRSGFSRVLVYLDGTDASGDVLDNAMAVASPEALFHVLRVLPMATMYAAVRDGSGHAIDVRNETWRELFSAKERLATRGITTKPLLIFDHQTAASTIVEQSRTTQSQLIVLAAGQYLLPWWLRNGAAEYVVRHAKVPILIVPASGSAGDFVPQREKQHVDIHFN